MLLNHHLVGFGPAREVFTRANLLSAFGGNLHLVQDDPRVLALTSSCCNEGEPE
jgi:hypothetical protein